LEFYQDLSQLFTALVTLFIKVAITETFEIITIQELIIDDLKCELFVTVTRVVVAAFIRVKRLIFSDNLPHFMTLFISTVLTIQVTIILIAIILLIKS